MRILLINPNPALANLGLDAATIAGTWPPTWAAHVGGSLRAAGFSDIDFIDAASEGLSDEALRDRLVDLAPDLVCTTALTPSIAAAARALRMAREIRSETVTVLGGFHATYLFRRILTDAPWIDAIVRGEASGETLSVLARAMEAGRWPSERDAIAGLAFAEGDFPASGSPVARVVATPARAPLPLDTVQPDWDIFDWTAYTYPPLGRRCAIVNMARGHAFTCGYCGRWKLGEDRRMRDPDMVADEVETLFKSHDVRFFALADEFPTRDRERFVRFCEGLISRGLPADVHWTISASAAEVRDQAATLSLYRQAGLIHVSIDIDTAAMARADRDTREAATTDAKGAIRLLRDADIAVECRFTVNPDTETGETLEEGYRLASAWMPDLASWPILRPWPLTNRFRETGDERQCFDLDHCGLVLPAEPRADALGAAELFERVKKTYLRFYARQAPTTPVATHLGGQADLRQRYIAGSIGGLLEGGFARAARPPDPPVSGALDRGDPIFATQFPRAPPPSPAAPPTLPAPPTEVPPAAAGIFSEPRAPGDEDSLPTALAAVATGRGPRTEARLNPETVATVLDALISEGLHRYTGQILMAAGESAWLSAPPSGWVEESRVARLHQAVRSCLSPVLAARVLGHAGRSAADQCIDHHVPAGLRRLLRRAPASLAATLAVAMFRRYAPQYIGTARRKVWAGQPAVFQETRNPLCAGERADAPVCGFHAGMIQRIFEVLVSPMAEIRETECEARGDGRCRFVVAWGSDVRRARLASRLGIGPDSGDAPSPPPGDNGRRAI